MTQENKVKVIKQYNGSEKKEMSLVSVLKISIGSMRVFPSPQFLKNIFIISTEKSNH